MKAIRSSLGVLGWLAAMVVIIAVAASGMTPDPASSGVALNLNDPDSLMRIAAGVIGMVVIPWQPALDRQQLDELVNPQLVQQPEVIPWQLYDTQDCATAVTTTLTFFQSIVGDKTLSNMEGPGQLPDPQYMIVHYVACDILQPAATTAVGVTDNNAAIANVSQILKTARASFEFNMSNKRYGPFSLTMCHATGGETGFGYAVGTLAAAVSGAYANNGNVGSGGFPFSGALVIPPKIGFDVKILFGAAPTLVGGPIKIRMSLVGALYRRVL